MIVWAAPQERIPVGPGKLEPEPEEQARELLQAQAAQNFPKEVRVQVEFIEMPHELLTELLYMGSPKVANAGILRDMVQARVKKGDAAILDTLMCMARSGEKAVVESIEEYIYPTEYTPAEVPNTVSITASAAGVPQENVTGLERLVTPPTAAKFETRNIGSSLEIEPTIGGDSRVIDLRFVPDLTWHTADTYYLEQKDTLGNVTKIQMPKMYSLRLNTALTCIDGQYTLIAAASPKDAQGVTDRSRKVMIFVKCDVLTVK